MSSLRCRRYRPLLSAYLDGDLADEERQRLLAHLATCEDCRQRLQEYQVFRERLRSLPPLPAPPQHLRQRVWQEIAEQDRRTPASRRARLALATTTLSVLLLLLALVSAGIGLHRSQPPRILASSPAAGSEQRWPIYQPVEIVFSKPMNEASVLANLRISPPGERERLPMSWSGTKLIIGADDERRVSLLPDTVYQIAILPEAQDRWGQPLGTTFLLTFRTTSAFAHTQETPAPTPQAALTPPTSPTPEVETPLPPPTPAAVAPPDRPSVPVTPAPEQQPHPVLPPPAVPEPTPPPAPTPTPTPQPPTPTPVPEPTPSPTPTAPPTPATPEPIPVTGAFARVYWANPAIQQRLGQPVSPAFVVNAVELAFQRGIMLQRFDTLRIYILEAGGQWASVPEPAPSDPPLEFRSVEANLWLPGGAFGQVWEERALASTLGYAIESDVHVMSAGARVQEFEHGTLILSDRGFVYVLFTDGSWLQVPASE